MSKCAQQNPDTMRTNNVSSDFTNLKQTYSIRYKQTEGMSKPKEYSMEELITKKVFESLLNYENVSIALFQRCADFGFNKSTALINKLCEMGIISELPQRKNSARKYCVNKNKLSILLQFIV